MSSQKPQPSRTRLPYLLLRRYLVAMTADKRLTLVRVKIERARKHLLEVGAEIRLFLQGKPYVIGTKRDPQTRRLIYYLVSVRDTPLGLAAMVGDVLQNLRSALDHLAYQLVLVGTAGVPPTRRVYFPIADDATKYKAEKPGRVKGMRQDAIDAMDALKPYKGGNDPLWRLHRLSIIDKHRLLITVGSAFSSVNVAPLLERDFPGVAGKVTLPPLWLKPADRLFPLKQGDELFADLPDTEVVDKVGFAFDLAFGEPQVVEGEPLLRTLQGMADLVDKIVCSFRPLLA
jgi:hypothetical protein